MIKCSNNLNTNSVTNINSLLLKNNSTKWNCGFKEWNSKKEDLEEISEFYNNFNEINPVSLRISKWEVEIIINDIRPGWFDENLSLHLSNDFELIFKKNNYYYSNPEFTDYIIDHLKIKTRDNYSIPCN